MTRAELDQIAWRSIHERPTRSVDEDRGGRPLSYLQLEEQLQRGRPFDLAWSDFLHAFYDYRAASFFQHSSPSSLDLHHQALLAGSAEWLSQEFALPHPAWTDERMYFLPDPWDPWQDLGLKIENLEERVARSPDAFRRRNISFQARDLIAL